MNLAMLLLQKHWGGEVHDVGITLLVLMPVPYVDASSSWAFPEKNKRILVSAMGIVVELFLSAIAFFVWLNVSPGIISSIAFNALLIGSVSTLLFNGNPLLKFDGYYILQDALEIPNLAARSKNYLAYLIKRYVFNVSHITSPVSIDGERRWLVIYAITSSIYKFFILFFIALFVAKKFLVVGVILVAWVLFNQIIKPIYTQIKFLISSPILQHSRKRAISITSFFVVCVLSVITLIPMPNWTRAEGVIWPSHESQIRIAVDGFVEKVVITDGSLVEKGELILRLDNPQLRAEEKITRAKLEELNARYASILFDKHAEAKILQEEIATLKAELKSLRNQLKFFNIYSPAEGFFSLASNKNIQGRFFNKGEIVAHILNHNETTALVVVSQQDVGAVRETTKNIGVRLSQQIESIYQAKITREVPEASKTLPSKALGVLGGGTISVDDSEGLTSREPLFLFELTLEDNVKTNFGERIYVRFDHYKEPLVYQWYRASRQLFMRNFNV